jgi:hypothetical protein
LVQNRRYLVYTNGLCAAYSLVSAFYTAVPLPVTFARSWIVFLLDLDQVIPEFLLSCSSFTALTTVLVRIVGCSWIEL